MAELNLKPRYPKRFKATTDSNHNDAIAPNLLDRLLRWRSPTKYGRRISTNAQIVSCAFPSTPENSISFYCAFTSKKLQHLIQSNRYYPHTKSSQIHFSEKEKVILQCIAAECTSKEIADQLSMSVRTVESYRKSMQEKTGSKNTAGLVLYAIKNGLIPIEKS